MKVLTKHAVPWTGQACSICNDKVACNEVNLKTEEYLPDLSWYSSAGLRNKKEITYILTYICWQEECWEYLKLLHC